MLSLPQFSRLFKIRATAQTYDEGEPAGSGGRLRLRMALANPAVLANEFENTHYRAATDSYITLLVYGWGGGLRFWLLVLTTIWRRVRFVLKPSPDRLLLIPLFHLHPLSIGAAIIDLDHWRHFFLIAGLIWGDGNIIGPNHGFGSRRWFAQQPARRAVSARKGRGVLPG